VQNLIGITLGHYGIVEQIGAGGMGVVYRAHDERLDRDVAIKVLPVEVASDPDRLRLFEREAKAVARLDHPNILAIHDFGTEGGVTYAVMELLKGVSLREVISGVGVTTGKAVEHARSIADGLTAAHDQGIIHRDLKPENIFLTKDGRIKILDFGLAKLKVREVDLTTGSPTETLGTAPGGLIGTIPYMAPEQLQGQPADHRSDIFALGVVLYEMLTGNRPFRGTTSVETAAAILKEDPEPISSVAPSVPPILAGVVSKCLEKRPEDRFNSAHDLALTLGAVESSAPPTKDQSVIAKRWPHILAVVIAAIIGLLVILPPEALFQSGGGGPSETPLPRIVVLPFENLGSPEDAYFADGMTDEVRGKLGRLAGLEVIARDSSDHYRATARNPRQIADELGVSYLLTAKVRWQKSEEGPSRIRLSSELVDVQPGRTPVAMWQESFDATLADVFQVQTDIATRVIRELHVVLGSEEQQAFDRPPTENLKAFELYLKAKDLRGRGLTMQLKEDLLQQAVKLDPNFAMAWAALAVVQNNIFWSSDISRGMEKTSLYSAHRALEIDPHLPEARYAMAYYYLFVNPNSEKARDQVELGLKSAPNHTMLLAVQARVTRQDPKQWDKALTYLQKAAALDPMSSETAWALGWHLLFMREHTGAEAALNHALLISPDNFAAIRVKAMVMLARGNLEGARRFLQRATTRVNQAEFFAYLATLDDLYWVLDNQWQELLPELDTKYFGGETADRSLVLAHTHNLRGERQLTIKWAEKASTSIAMQVADFPESSTLNSLLGVAHAYLGQREEALDYGRKGVRLFAIRPDVSYPYAQFQLVRIHILLGEYEPALDLLKPLLDVPFYLTPGWLSIDPLFDPLRNHPRFQALLEKYDTEQ